jgi:BirA family biotin operon repressor/biotin-[acetyl-CoA-carboxylase] ligase
VGVKWPNDVFCRGRKLGGILLEPSDRVADRLVIGIGLNVNNSLEDAPESIQSLATSLCDESGGATAREVILTRVLRTLDQVFRRLAVGDMDWPVEWSRHCVLTGRRIQVTAGDRVIEGVCAGIDEIGALRVGTLTGIERCLGGTVRVISEV